MSEPLRSLIDLRLRRREALALAGLSASALALPAKASGGRPRGTTFVEVAHGMTDGLVVPPGYRAQALGRWGDPLGPDGPPLDLERLTGEAQARQVGYNSDFCAYLPVPGHDENRRGVLFVNHETTEPRLMFREVAEGKPITDEHVRVSMQAHGASVFEIERAAEGWRMVRGRLDRRFTATTTFDVAGPAAGHPRMKTERDPTGRTAWGTVSNCSGGVTPWGTFLTCEENFNEYFRGRVPEGHPERRSQERYGVGTDVYPFWRVDERFLSDRHPHEPNRFGWIVEVEPFAPERRAVKRTALGRMKHEVAACTLDERDHAVVYTCDDEVFEYLYRFVSRGRMKPGGAAANRDLLDDGELSVAVFHDDGRLEWRPLVFGEGPLTPAHGFDSQGEVLIDTRRAADLVGATRLDRPEGIAIDPRRGRVYVSLSKNDGRQIVDGANPRAPNPLGHIVELAPPGSRGHSARAYRWDVFLLAGDPQAAHGARYGGDLGASGWFQNPDNLSVDAVGRLWIATDSYGSAPHADGLWVTDTVGPARGVPRHFLRVPRAAEVCSPCFTPDGRTLFCSIQHPGADGTLLAPTTRWPDFDDKLPPRSSVVAIEREDGGPIGT